MKTEHELTTQQRAEISWTLRPGNGSYYRRRSWLFCLVAASIFSVGCTADPTAAPVLVGEPRFAVGGGNPHFAGVKADPDDVGQLVISFKIVSSRDEVGADVTATAVATGTWACLLDGVLGGSAPNTQTVSNTGFFGAGADGKIVGSLSVLEPGPIILCAAPAIPVLTSVSFTNVQLTSPTAGTKLVSGTFTRTWSY